LPEPPAWVIGKQAAEALRFNQGLGDGPLDIWRTLRSLGVPFVRYNFGNAGPDGVYLFGYGQPLIVVNSAKPVVRQRFTAAHELGHHQLHRSETRLVIPDQDVYDTGKDPAEEAANSFAASFLLPDRALRALSASMARATAADVVQLVAQYGLSYDATVNCLHNYGLIRARQRDALKQSKPSNLDALLRGCGVADETLPQEQFPPELTNNALRLYQNFVITRARLSEVLRMSEDEALALAADRGFDRPQEQRTPIAGEAEG
jgi:Zn-dependent peptidase ImmA (M78 family)